MNFWKSSLRVLESFSFSLWKKRCPFRGCIWVALKALQPSLPAELSIWITRRAVKRGKGMCYPQWVPDGTLNFRRKSDLLFHVMYSPSMDKFLLHSTNSCQYNFAGYAFLLLRQSAVAILPLVSYGYRGGNRNALPWKRLNLPGVTGLDLGTYHPFGSIVFLQAFRSNFVS